MSKGRNKGLSPFRWKRSGAFRGKLDELSKPGLYAPSKKAGARKGKKR